MMERDKTLSPEMHEAIAMVHRNIQLEARLIDDLLDLTRIARGKITLRREAVDAHDSVEHALRDLSAHHRWKRSANYAQS